MRYEDSRQGTDGQYQASVQAMVDDHVHGNVSTMIEDLRVADLPPPVLDDICDLVAPVPRWRQGLLEELPMLTEEELIRGIEALGGEPCEIDNNARLYWLSDSEDSAREVLEELDIEPSVDDVLEHWLVSVDLADRLEKQGEVVRHPWPGVWIWGRTTSGQAICMDSEIYRIHDDWPRYEEQS